MYQSVDNCQEYQGYQHRNFTDCAVNACAAVKFVLLKCPSGSEKRIHYNGNYHQLNNCIVCQCVY